MNTRTAPRIPLSPVLVAELRARDPEYQAAHGGPPIRRGPRGIRPSAHGTAVGLRNHAEREERACASCAGLLADLHGAGLLAARRSTDAIGGAA